MVDKFQSKINLNNNNIELGEALRVKTIFNHPILH